MKIRTCLQRNLDSHKDIWKWWQCIITIKVLQRQGSCLFHRCCRPHVLGLVKYKLAIAVSCSCASRASTWLSTGNSRRVLSGLRLTKSPLRTPAFLARRILCRDPPPLCIYSSVVRFLPSVLLVHSPHLIPLLTFSSFFHSALPSLRSAIASSLSRTSCLIVSLSLGMRESKRGSVHARTRIEVHRRTRDSVWNY